MRNLPIAKSIAGGSVTFLVILGMAVTGLPILAQRGDAQTVKTRFLGVADKRHASSRSDGRREKRKAKPKADARLLETASIRQATRTPALADNVRVDQIYTGGKTATLEGAISRPSGGRSTEIGRIMGRDRCDVRPEDAVMKRVCGRVIETRAAEFDTLRQSTLTSEQRLLSIQRGFQSNMGAINSARRLGEDGSPESAEGQAVASLTFMNVPPKETDPKDETSALPAEAISILGAVMSPSTPSP